MLNKSIGEYTLFNGNKNHYIIFDLLKDHFVKNLRLKVCRGFNCTPKHFQVPLKKSGGIWGEKKKFIGKEHSGDYQYFDISDIGRYIRIDFNDTWGTYGGNYILIRELSFSVPI